MFKLEKSFNYFVTHKSIKYDKIPFYWGILI